MKRFALMLLPALLAASPQGDLLERHLNAGRELMSEGRSKDALDEFKAAQAIDPNRADVKEALSRARSGAPQSRARVKAKAGPTPTSGELRAKVEFALSQARLAYRDSDLKAAQNAWNKALQLDKSNAEAKAGLERLAAEAYRADADAPFDSSVKDLYEGALREARKDKLVEAKKKLEEARALNPSQPQVASLLDTIESGAYAQAVARQADEAQRQGERALKASDWPSARSAFEVALSLRPADPAAQDGLKRLKEASQGALHELLAKASKAADDGAAIAAYEQALAIDPGSQAAQEGLNQAMARRASREGQLSAKSRADALYNQGVEAWQAGQLALASQRFKQSLELAPEDAEAKKALEALRVKLSAQVDKDRAEALSLMDEGKRLEAKGKLKDALAAYERAASKDKFLASAAEAAERLKKETREP